jgi:hypothetical protein
MVATGGIRPTRVSSGAAAAVEPAATGCRKTAPDARRTFPGARPRAPRRRPRRRRPRLVVLALMTTEERFWAKVDRSGGPDACWLWTAGTFRLRNGYGKFGADPAASRTVYAHRFAYELSHGPIPPGLLVCHHCDNPPCCNPAHLFLGTIADNMRDMSDKGRAARQNDPTCKWGHAWTPENTRHVMSPNGRPGRVCRACNNEAGRESKRRSRAAARLQPGGVSSAR